MSKGEWEVGQTKDTVDCHIFKVERVEKTNPDGEKGDYIRINSPDWAIAIVETSDKNLVMVNQFRHGSNENLTEFPCGCVEPGELPMNAAIREAQEEIGLDPSKISLISKLYSHKTNPGFMSNSMHAFYIRTTQSTNEFLSDKSKQDADEFIKLFVCTPEAVEEIMLEDETSIFMCSAWGTLKKQLSDEYFFGEE